MRKNRVLAAFLAVMMLFGTMTTAFAEEIQSNPAKPAAIAYENGILLGKEATDTTNSLWGQGGYTKVSLTVNAPTDKFPVAVEFVLDCTESLMNDETTGAAYIMEYAEAIQKEFVGQDVYMGVTGFSAEAAELVPMQKLTAETAETLDAAMYKESVKSLISSVGTNAQAGIQMGLEKLRTASETYDIPAVRCYMVLITDGGSYWWMNGDEAVNNTCNGAPMGNADAADAGYAAGAFDLDALLQAGISAEQQAYTSDANEPLHAVVQEIKADENAYTNFETGVYFAAKALEDVAAAKMNLLTVGYPYYEDDADLAALTELAGQFVKKAASYNSNSVILDDLSYSTEAVAQVVDDIADAINIVVPKGSTVVDYMGWGEKYDFDLVPAKAIVLSVGANSYTGVQSGNTWTFADGSVLTYTPETEVNGSEHFVLTLGQDLPRGQKLVLTYHLRLVERDSAKGTHTVYTNVSPSADIPDAYLHPANLNDDLALPFPEPALQYKIGGGGGGSTIPEEPVPGGDQPELNTTDHYAYIIGRMDGLVHPEAQITRAEVATIYFRMLTDESRNALWSQSNPYPDVQPDMWCNAAISTMTRAGVIQGYTDGKFHPNDPITRAEFATIAVRFFEVAYSGDDKFSDIADHWAADYINKAAEAALIAGFTDGTFRPDVKITRAQAITIFNRVLGRAPEKDHLLSDMITWPDNLDTNAWYYAAMQEATNSHTYDKVTGDDGQVYEVWTKMLPVRDWAAFEKEWSDANSAANPGEVVSVKPVN